MAYRVQTEVIEVQYESSYEHQGLFFLLFLLLLLYRNTQPPNVSRYATIVSNGFLCALEACLDNLELP